MTTFLVAAALVVAPLSHPQPPQDCSKTYTRHMIIRGINSVYKGARDVSKAEQKRLHRYVRCARNQKIRPAMRAYWHKAWAAWMKRRNPPMLTAWASWYSLNGPGACGTGAQVGYHVAHKYLACDTRVEICRAACVIAIVADRGPYVAGREFDLNVNVRNAVGCPGVCVVRYRIL